MHGDTFVGLSVKKLMIEGQVRVGIRVIAEKNQVVSSEKKKKTDKKIKRKEKSYRPRVSVRGNSYSKN